MIHHYPLPTLHPPQKPRSLLKFQKAIAVFRYNDLFFAVLGWLAGRLFGSEFGVVGVGAAFFEAGVCWFGLEDGGLLLFLKFLLLGFHGLDGVLLFGDVADVVLEGLVGDDYLAFWWVVFAGVLAFCLSFCLHLYVIITKSFKIAFYH
jgi:hypothetical protein